MTPYFRLTIIAAAAVFACVLLLLPLLGCAGAPTLAKDLVTGDCVTATTGSLTVNGAVIRQEEIVTYCPPSIVANPAVAASAPIVMTVTPLVVK